jgi:hypothetical protein
LILSPNPLGWSIEKVQRTVEQHGIDKV